MWFYKKNHSGNANVSFDDLSSYLNLYVNFKLKVLDAKKMGLDKDTAYIAEVENYEYALHTQKRISKTNAEFVFIMNEYRDAVLMFNLSEMKIWNKAQNDESLLRSFYEKNKDAYLQRPFEEVSGQVIVDYQRKLERDWVESLKKTYTVKIYQDELRKLAKL